MKLLAINTSSILSAALFSREGTLAERNFFDRDQYKAEDLPLVLEELLPSVGWQPGEITHIAAAIGPGGYTGLRSGLALAKTLAQMNNLDVIGVNSLEAMAVLSPSEGFVVPLLDAKMKEVNWALYRKYRKNLTPEINPTLSSFDHMLELLNSYQEPIFFLGEEPLLSRREEVKQSLKDPLFTGEKSLNSPLAKGVGLIALQKIEKGETMGWKEIEPFYARPPVL